MVNSRSAIPPEGRFSPVRVSRIAAASVAAGLVVVGGVVVGQSAVAANHCSSGNLCVWDYSNWTGLLETKAGDTGLSNLPSADRDKASAWGNDSVYDGCLYDELNGTGAAWEMDSYNSDYFNIDRRDRAESWTADSSC